MLAAKRTRPRRAMSILTASRNFDVFRLSLRGAAQRTTKQSNWIATPGYAGLAMTKGPMIEISFTSRTNP
jgi:hypothetical protein